MKSLCEIITYSNKINLTYNEHNISLWKNIYEDYNIIYVAF